MGVGRGGRGGAQGVNVGYVHRHLTDFGLTWVFQDEIPVFATVKVSFMKKQ